MTAWQDQPPISRRQVRQNERDEIVGADDGRAQNTSDVPAEGDVARSGWDADARRASAPQGPPTTRAEAAILSGRRVQRPATNEQPETSAAPEQSSYRSRDAAGGGRRSALAPPVPPMNWAPADITEDPAAQHSGFDAIITPITATTPVADAPAPDAPADVEPDAVEPPVLQQFSEMPPAAASPSGEPTPYVPPAEWAPPTAASAPIEGDRPLTRRELRALGLGGFAPPPADEPGAPVDATPVTETPAEPAATGPEAIVVEPVTVEPVTAEPAAEVPVEVSVGDAPDADASVVEAPVVEAPVEEAPPAKPRFRDRFRSAAATELADPVEPAVVEPIVAEPIAVEPVDAEPAADEPITAEPVTPEPVAAESAPDFQFVATPLNDAGAAEAERAGDTVDAVIVPDHDGAAVAEEQPAFEDLLFPSGQPVETTIEPLPADSTPVTFDEFVAGLPVDDSATGFTPPVGHWSTQADIDDDEQVQESTFGRDVAATSGAITTSALVLPSIPTADDIMGPLSGTGEILITGSISLPSSIGTTGVHPARYDHSDVDALLEADDREDSDPESAPVRAIRAISTNTASGDVISSMKPTKNSRLPVILIVTASVVGAAAVVLLVVGMVTGIFN